ncbi:methyltransferase domain-containing protein [Motiliproteus coralliicola]|uniref:tRNA 5-carboxymethoxyuridine methyltransferase n=1 Tax=Motiliproteus coralliicola TaxID=2283196 RepID=A0A369WNU3_9GAMM|nr:methyltransferase domain-containing protein [Motiliproteus coralliicola]RDE22739.1 methyltransferase domain-containing protein [Motiliproteus coralliicola]
MSDQAHFDRLSERFGRNIYDTPKGRIRLHFLQQDLQALLEQDSELLILDAGGGQGQFARHCASLGHRVVLCDLSEQMLDAADQLNREQGLEDRIELVRDSIENFCHHDTRQYQLILCHAVLEWVQESEPLLQALTQRLGNAGRLSLMYYNRHSIVLRNALRGNFRKALSDQFGGDGGGLTPTHAREPQQIDSQLQALGMSIEAQLGVRCFYDYLPPKVRQTYAFEDILELEQRFRDQLPYRQMARYIHLIAAKTQQ